MTFTPISQSLNSFLSKIKEDPSNSCKQPINIPLNKELKAIRKQEALATIRFLTGAPKYFKATFNLLLSMAYGSDLADIVPAQSWIAKKIGSTRETVNIHTTTLSKMGLIRKTGRGYKALFPNFGIFNKYTCRYSQHKKLLESLKEIGQRIPLTNPLWARLFTSMPSLRPIFLGILTSMNLLFSNNIKKESVYKFNVILSGQKDSKIYKSYENQIAIQEREANLDTSSVSTHTGIVSVDNGVTTSASAELRNHKEGEYVFPEEHPMNVVVTDTSYPYNARYNTIEKREHVRRKILKVNNIDLRFPISAGIYKKIKEEDQHIVERYITGVRQHDTVHEYELSLIKSGKFDKIWKPTWNIMSECPAKMAALKSLPEEIQEELRTAVAAALKRFPNERKNQAWIYDYCEYYVKHTMHMNISDLLKKYNYNAPVHPRVDAGTNKKVYHWSKVVDEDEFRETIMAPTTTTTGEPVKLAHNAKFEALFGSDITELWESRANKKV